MTPAEAAVVLAYAARFDRRTVDDEDARAWAEALPDVSPQDAMAAIRHHFADSAEWLMPAHVRKRLRGLYGDERRPELAPVRDRLPELPRGRDRRGRDVASLRDAIDELRAAGLRPPPGLLANAQLEDGDAS